MFDLGFIKGDKVLDRWEIIEGKGFGGFGEVYKAYDSSFERAVALKFISKEKFSFEHRGFKVLLDVNHPNVVRVFDIMEFDQNYNFIISEFVEGDTLAEILNSKKIDLAEAMQIIKYMLEGIEEVSKVAWHRDVKPQNIMLIYGRPETLKILDLGLARVKKIPLSHQMSIGGTEGYTPPEVWQGEGDESWDVFMSGITIYQILTNSLPYGIGKFINLEIDKSESTAEYKLMHSSIKPMKYLCDLVMDSIRLDKNKRISSVNELHEKFKKIYSKYGKHKDAINFHDIKLREFYENLESKLVEEKIEIESCKDIQWGIQFEIYKEFVKCKFNVYSGKDGFKIVPNPPKNINERDVLNNVLAISCNILKISPISVELPDNPEVLQSENLFSNIDQIELLIKQKIESLIINGFILSREKELNYGTQYIVKYEGSDYLLNIYFSQKKGFSFVINSSIDDQVKQNLINLLNDQKKLKDDLVIVPYKKWIGSDESGKGDYFGPLVAAAFLVSKDIEDDLVMLGIKDSKSLSDLKIEEIARILLSNYRERIAICELPPFKYNDFVEKMKIQGKGLNTVLAWCHAIVIQDLAEKNDFEAAIADQFGDESYIRLEILKNPKMKDARGIELIQQPKAEKNIAVAAASILARDRFAKRIRELSEKYNIEIPKGAGPDANKVARHIISKYGNEELNQIVKIHFKNTKDIFESYDAKR